MVSFLLIHGSPPMLAVNTPSIPKPFSPTVAPEIRGVSFSTATIRSGRVAVAKIDCSGIRPQDLRCESEQMGFEVEMLPNRTRQGRFILIPLRIRRQQGVPRNLCLVRFSAASTSTLASLTVLA